MPELPEVETLKQALTTVVVGKTIKSATKFNGSLTGVKITGVDRRAKILLFYLNNKKVMAVHLKMTGQLVFEKANSLIMGGHPEDPTKYTRARFYFTDGSTLRFNDLRKFGWIKILPIEKLTGLIGHLGPEPLGREFTPAVLLAAAQRYPNRPIKSLLLDQTLIAGVGNIYADESCFAAGILPSRPAGRLKPAEIKRLARELCRLLKLSIKHGGTSTRNYRHLDGGRGGFVKKLKVYGRGSKKCLRCATPIQKIKQAGRGTHFCPRCQK